MTADQIVDNYLTAIGGQAAWLNTRSVFMLGKKKGTEETWVRTKVEFPVEVPFKLYVKRPGKFLSVIDSPHGQFTSACDGNGTLWFDSPAFGFQSQKTKGDNTNFCEAILQPLPLLWRARNWKVELKGKKRVNGKEAWVLRVTPGKEDPETHYFDVASQMHVKAELSGFGYYQTWEYSDFRAVSGLTFPFKVFARFTATEPLFEKEGTTLVEQIRVNQALDDQWFIPPNQKPAGQTSLTHR